MNEHPTEPLPLSPAGETDLMTWRAAYYALVTPGILPVAVGPQAAGRLMEEARQSGEAGFLAGAWRVRCYEAEVHIDRFLSRYRLRFTPLGDDAELAWEEVQRQDLGLR